MCLLPRSTVMVSHVFAHVQTHQIAHIKYVQFFILIYQLYIIKAINREKKKQKKVNHRYQLLLPNTSICICVWYIYICSVYFYIWF